MKRTLYFAFLLALLSSITTSAANASIKTGASCPKIGKVAKVNGKEFKCIKLGTKQVWSAVKPTANPSPTSQVRIPAANYKPQLGPVLVEKILPFEMPANSTSPNLKDSEAYHIQLPKLTGFIEYYSDLFLDISALHSCWRYADIFPENSSISYIRFVHYGAAKEYIYLSQLAPNLYCEIRKPATIEFFIQWKPTEQPKNTDIRLTSSGIISLD